MRSAVLAATLEVLTESGPTGVTIGEVATRAGVHETSIYRRWGTRDRLVLDAMISRSDDLLQVPDTGSLRGDLVELGQHLIDYARAPLGEALIRTLAGCTDDQGTAQVRTDFWNARHDECKALVERAKTRGELHPSTNSRLLLEVFIAPVHFRLLLTRESVDRAFLRKLADIAVRGVTTEQPA